MPVAMRIVMSMSGLPDEVEERKRSAVRDGRLLRIEPHFAVVDALRMQCAHEMLDREELRAVLLDRRRAERRCHMVGRRMDARLAVHIRADKDDARPRSRRPQLHVHLAARMEPDARIRRRPRQRCLLLQGASSPFSFS